MYEINTATKTLTTATTEAEALKIAAEAFKVYKYVEVMKVITITPWRAESVRVLTR